MEDPERQDEAAVAAEVLGRPEGVVAVADAAEPGAHRARRPRRRGRTTGLVAAAAVLGVVAGGCTGYLIQADRKPTALPPLSQPVVHQAKGEVEALSAAQDSRVRTDGDLRKLLLARPKGARGGFLPVDADGWLDQASYADSFDKPSTEFTYLTDNEFRRAAGTSWRVGDTYEVEVTLVQFRQQRALGASKASDGAQYWAEKAPNHSWPIPGTGDGMVYVHDTPEREAGVSLYTAEAQAWRGDIAVQIWVHDTRPVTKGTIMDLAERQVKKL
jgi:hypothetical protein